jgi:hypothetical protein
MTIEERIETLEKAISEIIKIQNGTNEAVTSVMQVIKSMVIDVEIMKNSRQ